MQKFTTSTFTPGPPLSDFVEQFWLVEGLLDGNARELILPTGLLELIVDVSPRASTGPLLSGARSQSLILETNRVRSIVGVEFVPGGAAALLNISAGAIRNTLLPLEEIWGRPAVSLSERLAQCRRPELRFGILEQVLLARLARGRTRNPDVTFAVKEFQRIPDGPSVGAVAREVGLTPKRFINVFRDEIGLSPKLFCRVRRFQNVVQAIERSRTVQWAALASSCGYSDRRTSSGTSGNSPD